MISSFNQNSTSANLFVGGLAFNISEKDLQKYFQKFGPVRKVNLLRRSDNNMSKGYAFVFFENFDSVERVLECEDHFIKGRKIDCQIAQERPFKQLHQQTFNSKRIYVGKLAKGTCDEDLTQAFRVFGKIKSAYIINDSLTNVPLNFGYVVFADVSSAEKALAFEDITINGSKVVVKNYKSKPEIEESKRTLQPSGDTIFSTRVQPTPTSIEEFTSPVNQNPSRVAVDFSRDKSLAEKLREVRELIPLTREQAMKASELMFAPKIPTGRFLSSEEIIVYENGPHNKVFSLTKVKQEFI